MIQQRYDVGIVGAGPAGLTAAYFAARAGARVIVLDHRDPPAQKIRISGGGRCNILPAHIDPSAYTTDSSPYIVRNILRAFPLSAAREFLTAVIGLELFQDGEKVYPRGGGEEVQHRFIATARHYGAVVRAPVAVTGVKKGHIILAGGEKVLASRVILATGGMSYPRTGSDGTGFAIARRLGHTVIEPYPALVALRGGSDAHHALAGVSVPAKLTVTTATERAEHTGGFLFTHRGYSGPVVLNLGHLAARAQQRRDHATITVAWNALGAEDWEAALAPSGKTVRGQLRTALPIRLVDLILAETAVPGDVKLAQMRRDARQRLVTALAAYRLPWTGTEGLKTAEVTGGGVALSEIDAATMRSRVHPWLYLCGEILDAFGPIGGANFLWAFATGKLAGSGAAA